ncbi:MAG TPA: potassium/proton antiporter [Xanthomonadaceae bacterium]|nr:potassium/proton antiporter [Xanthomonadaceae bacterium]
MESLQTINWLLLGGALMVLAGIASSLIATRFGAPLLLVFLVLGMLLGEEGPGGIPFDDYATTYLLGSIALAVILFDGGLRTRVATSRDALAPAGLLATLGVLVTAGLTGVAAHLLIGLGWVQGLLLGAIVASTDAAAVFFLLRAGGLHLQRRVGATLEIESGSNDPAAVFLTIALVGWLASNGDGGWPQLLVSLGQQILVGGVGGALGGLAIARALNRLALPSGLHPLLAIAGGVSVFALTSLLGGSGFLAVYLAGLVVGNRPVRAFANVLSVQDAVTWLAQLVMFLVLGLLVTPSHLLAAALPALAIAAFLMFVARPLAVTLCLAPFRFRRGERAFIAWVGLRGAVGIFLASIPMLVALPDAEVYFNVAFVVVLTSLLVQGWSLGWAAHRWHVALPRHDPPMRRIELDLPGQLEYEMVGYRVEPGCAALHGSQVPAWARAALVARDQTVLTPELAGPLQVDDYAYFLAPPERAMRLDWLFAEPGAAREVEREVFGEFTFPGDVPLGALADFYDLNVPARHAQRTATELFARRFEGEPQVGDRIRLGQAVLTVREVADDQVARVGLKFETVGAALFGEALITPRARSPLRRAIARLMGRRYER